MSAAAADNDLSEYERQRLANIARNTAVLASLGLDDKDKRQKEALQAKKDSAKRKRVQADRERRLRAPTAPTRTSRRLRKQPRPDYREDRPVETNSPTAVQSFDTGKSGGGSDDDNDDEEDDDEEEDEEPSIDYASMPQEPNDLDDQEFQVYVLLKAWRLHRHRELEIEPYKICQNRTLCELTRRRRNDPAFAGAGSTESLIEVWGIGPSKVETFGPEMIEILEGEEALAFLKLSREEEEEAAKKKSSQDDDDEGGTTEEKGEKKVEVAVEEEKTEEGK
jgi:hypothetical protein